MIKHVSIRISGKVQGVFFRASTKTKADELLVRGIVRNEPDGSVYVEAEGEEEPLKKFIQWCYQGPTAASVRQCEITPGEAKGYTDFSIRR